MHWLAKGAIAVVGVVGLAAAGGAWWATSSASTRMAQSFTAHDVAVPMPFPLTAEEVDALRAERLRALEATGAPTTNEDGTPVDVLAGVDLDAVAMERAVARGKHLSDALYSCRACHGDGYGGGVMVDDPMLGRLLGPNLTTGKGSRTLDYTMVDWDHMVRHGIKPDGHPTVMPAQDFVQMSDQELSDLVAYIRSLPPVDNTVAPVELGPIGTVLVATGQLFLAAEMVHDHEAAHKAVPPSSDDTLAYGAHLAAVCTGCHHEDLAGGPVPGGPPDWPPAANLTPGPDGLQGWSYDDFMTALTDGKRPDGTALRAPMTEIGPYAAAMNATEREALWAYLQSVPAAADRQ